MKKLAHPHHDEGVKKNVKDLSLRKTGNHTNPLSFPFVFNSVIVRAAEYTWTARLRDTASVALCQDLAGIGAIYRFFEDLYQIYTLLKGI